MKEDRVFHEYLERVADAVGFRIRELEAIQSAVPMASERHFKERALLVELALAIFANVGRVVIKDTNKLPLPRAGSKDGRSNVPGQRQVDFHEESATFFKNYLVLAVGLGPVLTGGTCCGV